MKKEINLSASLLNSWKTTNEISVQLLSTLDPDVWNRSIPGYRRKTVRMLAVHLHNVRCMWIKGIGKGKFVAAPARLDATRSTQQEVVKALQQSGRAISSLLKVCLNNGGMLPTRPAWLNFPNDVIYLLAYFVAHEAHHRGQIIMVARQLNHALPRSATGALWQWKSLALHKAKFRGKS